MGYLIAIVSSLYIFCYYCRKLSILKNRIFELKKEIEMAEKDLADVNQDVNDLKVHVAVELGKIYAKLAKIEMWIFLSGGTSFLGVVAQIIMAIKK